MGRPLIPLEELYVFQKEMMAALGIDPVRHSFSSAAVTEAVNGLVEESVEVLKARHSWTKPWKGTTALASEEETVKESIDVLFMLLELWILLGVTPQEVKEAYVKKLNINKRRIEESRKSKDISSIIL